MKVVKTENHQPLTLAQTEFCHQLEQSELSGQALWHPRVAAGDPAPDCIVFLKGIGRFAITFPSVEQSVEDDEWTRQDADGGKTSVPELIEENWQAAKAVRATLRQKLDIGAYVIPVINFTDLEPDAGIMEAAQGCGVRVFFGQDVVQRLAHLPDEEQRQPQLGNRYIAQEMAALRQKSTAVSEPVPEPERLEVGDGRLVIQHVDVVNVYLTTGADANGGVSPRLETTTLELASLEVGDGRLVIQQVDVVNVYITASG